MLKSCVMRIKMYKETKQMKQIEFMKRIGAYFNQATILNNI